MKRLTDRIVAWGIEGVFVENNTAAFNRLAAYEDTGLEPSEVAASIEITSGAYGFCPTCGDAYELDIVDGKPVMMCDGCGPLIALAEVAALVARCEAAERDIRELLAQPDYVGVCWACAKVSTPHSECDPQWRGPQEGATAHERV